MRPRTFSLPLPRLGVFAKMRTLPFWPRGEPACLAEGARGEGASTPQTLLMAGCKGVMG